MAKVREKNALVKSNSNAGLADCYSRGRTPLRFRLSDPARSNIEESTFPRRVIVLQPRGSRQCRASLPNIQQHKYINVFFVLVAKLIFCLAVTEHVGIATCICF